MRSFFKRLKSGTEYLNYGRQILQDWGAQYTTEQFGNGQSSAAKTPIRIFDLGCGHGADLLNIKNASPVGAKVQLSGIESYGPYVKECKQNGISTFALDLERDPYPHKDASVDIVIANQILEHTKEIFWIFSEVTRILKPGGRFLIGVPNLASLHNRLLLLVGEQPTAQQSMSAHVRTFTKPDMRRFAQTGNLLALSDYRGSNFYPFPKAISQPLSRLFPTLAWGSFYNFLRTAEKGNFLDCLYADENFLETPFYGSPQNPAKKGKQTKNQTKKRK